MMARKPTLLVFLALLAVGCSSNRQSGPQVGPGAIARDIYVENGTSVDLQISVVSGTLRTQAGTVRARGNRSIRLPRGITTSFQLLAEPLGGGGRLVSPPILISDASRATWEIRASGSSAVRLSRRSLRP